jgi:putative transposase
MLLQLENGRHLPRIMQRVLFGYVRYYKKKMKYVGHLWQGRYKCLLIGKESYLLECGRYIERNPLRAGMVQRLDDYRWSSYVYYANGKPDDLIEPNPYYEQMGFNPEERQSNYRDFVRLENPYSGIIDQTLIQKHF